MFNAIFVLKKNRMTMIIWTFVVLLFFLFFVAPGVAVVMASIFFILSAITDIYEIVFHKEGYQIKNIFKFPIKFKYSDPIRADIIGREWLYLIVLKWKFMPLFFIGIRDDYLLEILREVEQKQRN